jgi:hypothetical protein
LSGSLHGESHAAGDIAVSIEQISPLQRGLLARAYGLSRLESELLDLFVSGSDTGERVSGNTGNDYLKSIFTKSGVLSRHALLSRALGSSAPAGPGIRLAVADVQMRVDHPFRRQP